LCQYATAQNLLDESKQYMFSWLEVPDAILDIPDSDDTFEKSETVQSPCESRVNTLLLDITMGEDASLMLTTAWFAESIEASSCEAMPANAPDAASTKAAAINEIASVFIVNSPVCRFTFCSFIYKTYHI
jgi:hypothetical protein